MVDDTSNTNLARIRNGCSDFLKADNVHHFGKVQQHRYLTVFGRNDQCIPEYSDTYSDSSTTKSEHKLYELL